MAAMKSARLTVKQLEDRDMPSVSSVLLSGSTVIVQGNNSPTDVEIVRSGSNIVVKETTTGRTWANPVASVAKVDFRGGASNDKLVNWVQALPITALGYGGNDYFETYNGADYLDGGSGDDTLIGWGGDDTLYGGLGNDLLLGMDGNDYLDGNLGNDQLNGGKGTDTMWGSGGDDVIIAIDNGTTDYVDAGSGRDVVWADQTGNAKDTVYGMSNNSKTQYVRAFANAGADRTLDGDRIADPTAKGNAVYKTFANQPLFASNGPTADDIHQGNLADCWVLAELGATAAQSPFTLRQRVVDFNDGTYGVQLGDNFYRVDNDLPVANSNATNPAYAGLGAVGSMWVAIVEKAYAHYRTGANSYASIEWGNSDDAARALGATDASRTNFNQFNTAADLVNSIYDAWNSYKTVCVGITNPASNAHLVSSHAYTVFSVQRNAAGRVTSITLRNPWGTDGGGNNDGNNDGYVTVTPAQLFNSTGCIYIGTV